MTAPFAILPASTLGSFKVATTMCLVVKNDSSMRSGLLRPAMLHRTAQHRSEGAGGCSENAHKRGNQLRPPLADTSPMSDLTILMPTFNRAAVLRETLEAMCRVRRGTLSVE